MNEQALTELRQAATENELEVVEVGEETDCRALVLQCLGRDRPLIIVAGGDGTIHHLIQAMVGTEAILGILPQGTFNHLARDLDIPLDWRAALQIALNAPTRQIDVGSVNGRYFLNNIMLGVYQSIVYHRERLRPGRNKWRAYAGAISAALKAFPHVALVLESPHHMETIRTQLFVVAVNSYDLSAPGLVAPKATIDRGRLGVYWLPFMTRRGFVSTLLRYARGRVEEVQGFRRFETSSFKVSTGQPRMRFAIDGEMVEMPPPLHVTILPASLNVRLATPRLPDSSP